MAQPKNCLLEVFIYIDKAEVFGCLSHVFSMLLGCRLDCAEFITGSSVFTLLSDKLIRIRQKMNISEFVLDWMFWAIREHFLNKRGNSTPSIVLISKSFVSRNGLSCSAKNFAAFKSIFCRMKDLEEIEE